MAGGPDGPAAVTTAKRSPRWAAVLTTLFLAIPPASTPPVQARACPARAEHEAELLAVGLAQSLRRVGLA